MYLKSFKKNTDSDTYHLSFSDGTESDVTLKGLRDNCPCAGCKGEGFLFTSYEPVKTEISPDGYKLEKIQPVGNYAVQLFWKDGHHTGIYTWVHLKEISNNFKS